MQPGAQTVGLGSLLAIFAALLFAISMALVRLLTRTGGEAQALQAAREHTQRLPGQRFPDPLRVTGLTSSPGWKVYRATQPDCSGCCGGCAFSG